ncbi:MFS transporter [Janthinobacterium sp. B9-8]|uniref:MFS transporter n=1 Tax=Janthinobacterium sp. B9-8 TaxID=1236179 RepID=UPI0021500634|nr:MFS transporter [Janthinobacterium sp. B9-8]
MKAYKESWKKDLTKCISDKRTAPTGWKPVHKRVHQLTQKQGNYSFWFTRVLSASGFQILSVALAWQVYSLSHQVLDLGLIDLAQFTPCLLFMLSAGDAAERYDRGRIVAISQLVQALTA